MPEYVVVEYPDGARYAVPADSMQHHPGAVVVGREGDTGVPQPLEPETAPEAAPEPEHVPAPEEVPAEQAPAPEAAATEASETPAP